MSHCWELRGCDDEMQSRCPHNIPGEPCPADCKFAACERPTHQVAWGLAMLDNPDVDREAAVKEGCRTCTFFISHGPLIGECTPTAAQAREREHMRKRALEQTQRQRREPAYGKAGA